MPAAKSAKARRNEGSSSSTTSSSRIVSVRRFIATLALPIAGLNYLLLVGSNFSLPLIFLFLIAAAIVGFLLAAGEGQTVEEQSKKDEDLLPALFASSPDALFLLEPLSGEIVDANSRALELFEAASKDELVGVEFSSLQRVRLTDEKALEVLTSTNKQGRWAKEATYTTRRGKELWGELVIKEFRRAQQPFLLARVIDITEHKRREEKAAQDKETVETANAAKAEFLADLSQRLLLSVGGTLQTTGLLRDTQLTPEQKQYTELGRQAADALLTTVNDILDFGNFESGKLSLEPIAFDLRTTIEESIGRFTKHAENIGVELTCLMSHDVPTPLWGDPGRLRQVFTNIIENALASPSPGSVTIRGMMTHRAPTCVTFRFSVTAPGFELSQLAPLFPLSAPNTTLTRIQRSQWLGLAVSKNLVKLLGGEMGVAQEPSQEGTVWFTVTLERQPPKALAAPPPRHICTMCECLSLAINK